MKPIFPPPIIKIFTQDDIFFSKLSFLNDLNFSKEVKLYENKPKNSEMYYIIHPVLKHISILKNMLIGQQEAILAVKKELESIESAICLAEKTLKNDKNKIIYVGAGTSGRIGILDGVELIPTFGWPEERVDFCFSGIEVNKTSEGSEDDTLLAVKHFKKTKIKKGDVVLCLAASGSTIYTKTILKKSKEVGAVTISFSNNEKSILSKYSDVSIFLNTGAEFIAGSTRLSAGTSQKIALNLFSTCLMIRLNKVYKGFMVDMKPTNIKLKSRAEKILSNITNIFSKNHVSIKRLIQNPNKDGPSQYVVPYSNTIPSAIAIMGSLADPIMSIP